ncbi:MULTISPECIES: ABC transporter permease [unclassified Rhizobium]|nr:MULTISPECIES: ABC transporter permease [unclassified Rhizobium]MDH7808691.1 putative spermidine/putrescine transport system permease protein [Rhizobium sp. AN67]MDQ4409268.1 ABC transporter permease [Rhizobium sp. AN63]SOC90287.1 putative spermidine/putrescine transport system permease protein [Rhizobium sp. AN5]SOD50806.1 putative spermidine/putrescine transport system permease protein [Rhizobium sp. AN6A]
MQKNNLSAAGMLMPATTIVLVFMALPLLYLLRYSMNSYVPGQFMVSDFTLANFSAFFSDSYYLKGMRTTILMSFGVTVVCLIVGLPLANWISRKHGSMKTFLLMLIILPLFISNAVRAAGWMVAFGKSGVLNYGLLSLGLISTPLEIMYTPLAVFVGIVAVNLPYVVLTLQSVLEGLDENVEFAAASLGATPLQNFLLVKLPQIIPGLLAAFVLSFILTMNAYATPVLLGGPSFRMMSPMIVGEILNKANWPFGAALSFILLSVTISITVVAGYYVKRKY